MRPTTPTRSWAPEVEEQENTPRRFGDASAPESIWCGAASLSRASTSASSRRSSTASGNGRGSARAGQRRARLRRRHIARPRLGLPAHGHRGRRRGGADANGSDPSCRRRSRGSGAVPHVVEGRGQPGAGDDRSPRFAERHLASSPKTNIDWLCSTGQSVLEVIAGSGVPRRSGRAHRARSRLTWFPPAVEQTCSRRSGSASTRSCRFIRSGPPDRGDQVGSRVITARLARERDGNLTLLTEKSSGPPYSKWLGSGYGNRPAASTRGRRRVRALDELAGRPVTVPVLGSAVQDDRPGLLASLAAGLRCRSASARSSQWCDNVDVLGPTRRARAAYEA